MHLQFFFLVTLVFHLLTLSCGDDPSYRGSGSDEIDQNIKNRLNNDESIAADNSTDSAESERNFSNQATPSETTTPTPSSSTAPEMTCKEKFNLAVNPIFTTRCIGCHGYIADFRITQNEDVNFSLYESAFIGSEDEMTTFFSENGSHAGGPQETMSESLLMEMKSACN